MSYNILLVDDDNDFRKEIRYSLFEYNIIEAKCGKEAIEKLKVANLIDIVLLDVRMPGLNGIKIIKEIKTINPNLYVIILTGYSTKDIAIQSLKEHADDYIEKPVKINEIKEIIKKIIEKNIIKGSINVLDIEEKIEKAKLIAERNFDKKISLKDVTDIICLSPKYFSRIFKECTGLGFGDYKLNVKVNKSKELLINKSKSIEQVSYELGYKNVESFIRIFKKITGFTPSEFRENQRLK